MPFMYEKKGKVMMEEKNGIDPGKERNGGGKQKERKVKEERRAFLKKAVYTAPSLMILGQLSRPASSSADDFGGPPSDAKWGN